ncbi:MAG: 3'-5' exonuclease [Planctomycetota bacterium]
MGDTAILLDTEVNNLIDKDPIEVAWAYWEFDGCGVIHSRRFRPLGPISAGAALVHGILPCDLADQPPSSEAIEFVPRADYTIAHNVDFDWEVMGSPPSTKRICTLALARKVWPDFESHKLGALIYELRGFTPRTRDMLSNAHEAGADVGLLATVLDAIMGALGLSTIESLWEASESARIPEVIRFGKHSGSRIEDLPSDYVRWLLNQDWLDPYMRMALES